MLIIGLTGSIGMGKSTAAKRFIHHGIDVFDADKAVHDLYDGPVAEEIEAAFPGVVVDGKVDRKLLSSALKLNDENIDAPSGFKKLEAIIHPKVRAMEKAFLQNCYAKGDAMAVLEIPLFFETNMDDLVDISIVVVAPDDIRNARVLSSRPQLSAEKLRAIVAKQMSDEEKCKRADYVVDTGGSIQETYDQIDKLIESFQSKGGNAYQLWA